MIDRAKTQSIDPSFDYTQKLFEDAPLPISVVIDARGSQSPKVLADTLAKLVNSTISPAEIIVVSNNQVKIPDHSNTIRVENIIDRKQFKLTALDYGFMVSNYDIIAPVPQDIGRLSKNELSLYLKHMYISAVSNEAALVINDPHNKLKGLKILTENGVDVVAIRKADLLEYLQVHDSIYEISKDTLGHFLSWLTVQCKPVGYIDAPAGAIDIHITANTLLGDYPILHKQILWNIKKSLRSLHLSRIINKALRYVNKETVPSRSVTKNPTEASATTTPSRQSILDTPIFINTRDRFDPLVELVNWLKKAGHNKIVFIDNNSTYPPLLNLFDNTKFQPIRLGRNGMHKAPWESFAIRFIAKGGSYIVTDPDILPTKEMPLNSIEKLYSVLDKYPKFNKVGVGLKIDDMPDHYSLKNDVIKWESRFWDKSLLLEKDVYAADLDTTFALYRPKTWWFLSPSIRLGGDYVARHEPWYQNLDSPTEDMAYYRMRASNEVSTWTKGKLPKHHLRALKKEGLLSMLTKEKL